MSKKAAAVLFIKITPWHIGRF